ncbi:hypothetical protein TMatcc_000500 [Talaromyces marneffei ATCC 18224]
MSREFIPKSTQKARGGYGEVKGQEEESDIRFWNDIHEFQQTSGSCIDKTIIMLMLVFITT